MTVLGAAHVPCRTDRRAPLCLWGVGRAAWVASAAGHLEQSVLEEAYSRSDTRWGRGRFCARSIWVIGGARLHCSICSTMSYLLKARQRLEEHSLRSLSNACATSPIYDSSAICNRLMPLL